MSQKPWVFLLSLMLTVIVNQNAHASVGVVVRLVRTSGAIDGPIVAALTNEDGKSMEMSLQDDGTPPDVVADDQQYSGAFMVEGDTFEATISFNGQTHALGSVSWSDSTAPRDLIITEGKDGLTAEPNSSTLPDGQDGPTNPTVGEGDLGGASPPSDGLGKSLTAAPPRAPAVSFSNGGSSAKNDGTLYLLAGGLVLVLALAAFFWLRGTGRGDNLLNRRHLTQIPEPGVFGSDTPSLSDGLSLWQVNEAAFAPFSALLLQAIAQHHRVLIVADANMELPTVQGGPLYRAKSQTAIAVADAAITLIEHPGLPVAVIVVAETLQGASLVDYEAVLVPDVGVIAVVTQLAEGQAADVCVTLDNTTCCLDTATAELRVEEHPWGLNILRTPKAPAPETSAPAPGTSAPAPGTSAPESV